ncbi:hypothetical protein SK128_021259, partial [Halocaridina rubra]
PPWEVRAWVESEKAEAGQVVSLICQSSSSLPPSIVRWRSGSMTLHGASSSRSPGLYGGTVTRSELEVRALIEDNGRLFICNAENGLATTVTTNITLNVLHGPVWITVPTGTVDVYEKDDLVLTAKANANPLPVRYSWWRGPLMMESVEDNTEEDHEGGGQFVMKRVHRQEAGGYSVTASSPRGIVNASFIMNVLYGPETITAAERVTVDEYGSTSVVCSAVGNPSPNITWFKQEDNTSAKEMLSWGINEARLIIESASRATTGFYRCQASNVVATKPPISTAVVVTQAPEPLSEEDKDEEEFMRPWAKIGGTGKLECLVQAAPAPNYRWSIHEDRVLFNSRKYFIKLPQLVDGLVEWSSVLEIRNITEKDYTTYTCTVTNSRGSYVFNHTLGPPVPPNPPQTLNVTSVMGSTAILSWVPSDQGTTPEGYILTYRQKQKEKYEQLEINGEDRSKAKVQNLAPGVLYEFTIQAYNEQGRSEHTLPPVQFTVPGVVEEVASSSSQPRVPRLTLLLMSLTGVALLVLNISIIICFVKRFASGRSTSGSSFKTTVSDTYTPASTPGLTAEDEEKDESSDTIISQYQISCKSSLDKDNEDSSLITQHIITSEVPRSPKNKLKVQTSIPLTEQFLNRCSPGSKYKSALINGGVNFSTSSRSSTPKIDSGYTESVSEWKTIDCSTQLDDNISRRMKVSVHPSDIPDVCPKSPGSNSSLPRYEPQEESTTMPRDNLTHSPQQSSPSLIQLAERVDDLGRQPPMVYRHQDNMSPPLALMPSTPSKLLTVPYCHDSSARSSISEKSESQDTSAPCCSNKPKSQVIYHGQPHIQKQHELEEYQQQLQQFEHHHQQHLTDFHPPADEQPPDGFHTNYDHENHTGPQNTIEDYQHADLHSYTKLCHQTHPHFKPDELVAPCCQSANPDVYQPQPCCHHSTFHLDVPEHPIYPENPARFRSHHSEPQLLPYLQYKSHSLPRNSSLYNYPPSEYHYDQSPFPGHQQEPQSTYYPSRISAIPATHLLNVPRDRFSVLPHSQSEQQYPLQYADKEYMPYPQKLTEHHPLQYRRGESHHRVVRRQSSLTLSPSHSHGPA